MIVPEEAHPRLFRLKLGMVSILVLDVFTYPGSHRCQLKCLILPNRLFHEVIKLVVLRVIGIKIGSIKNFQAKLFFSLLIGSSEHTKYDFSWFEAFFFGARIILC